MSIKRDDRQAELLGQLHAAQGLAVALGVGQAEVALDLFLGVAALVVADEHDLVPAEAGQAALDGGVVAEVAVAVQLAELAADQLDVVLEQRPLRVAGDLHRLPGAEVVVGLAEQGGVVGAKLAKLLGVIDAAWSAGALPARRICCSSRASGFSNSSTAERVFVRSTMTMPG